MPWWDPANFTQDKKKDGKTGFGAFVLDPLNLAGRKDAGPPPKPFFESDTFKTMQKLRPEFASITGPSGQLGANYAVQAPDSNMAELQQMLGGINVDMRGLEALRGEGLRAPGAESAWSTLAKQQQGIEEQGQLDKVGRTGAAGTAAAYSGLAQRGGATEGARERVASMSALNMLRGRQGVAGQGAAARAAIGTQDESNRLGILKALPGMETAAVQPGLQKANLWSTLADQESGRKFDANKFNTTNLIDDRNKKNEFDMSKYQEQMAAWGADRTATAQENSGKK